MTMGKDAIGKTIFMYDESRGKWKNAGIITNYYLPNDENAWITKPYSCYEIKKYDKKYHSTNCFVVSEENMNRFLAEKLYKIKETKIAVKTFTI